MAGVHADGDNKRNLYYNDLLPERFGRRREYALGKNSGKANIRKNLEDLGLQLDDESMRKVTERIIELGDKKELVTQEDLPYIVSDVLKHDVRTERVKLKSYIVNLAYGLKPMATIKVEINGKEYEENSSGDGQYDAFVRALRKVYKGTLGRRFPRRAHGRFRTDGHHVELRRQGVPHPRTGRRPDGGGHQGYDEDAEPHRGRLWRAFGIPFAKHRRVAGTGAACSRDRSSV